VEFSSVRQNKDYHLLLEEFVFVPVMDAVVVGVIWNLKDQSELQAMHRYLLKHKVQSLLSQLHYTIEMKDRKNVLDWDRLSTYDQDVLHLLALL
jgi:hypothetical protein